MNDVPQPTDSFRVLLMYYIFKCLPFLVSGLAIWLGFHLFRLGVTGQASLSIDAKDVKGQLINAAPGLFFAIGGFVISIVAIWKGVEVNFAPRKAGENSEERKFNQQTCPDSGNDVVSCEIPSR